MAIGGNTKSASASVCLDKGYNRLDSLKKLILSGKAVRYAWYVFLYICVCHSNDLVAHTVEFIPLDGGQILLECHIIATKGGDFAREIGAKGRWNVASVDPSSPRADTIKEYPLSFSLSDFRQFFAIFGLPPHGKKVSGNGRENGSQRPNNIRNDWRCVAWHSAMYVLGAISGLILYFSAVLIAERLLHPSSKHDR